MTYSNFKENLDNWTLPGYVHELLKHIRDPLDIKFDGTTRFRYIIFAGNCQVRVNEKRGIVTPANPTKLQLRHADLLSHEQLREALRLRYR